MPSEHIRNPQTEALLQMLQLPYNLEHGKQQRLGAEDFDRQQQRLLSGGLGGGGGEGSLPPPPARPVTDAQVSMCMYCSATKVTERDAYVLRL